MLKSNISFLSKDEAKKKNSRGAAEYFLLQVLGPGFVIVVAVVVAVTAQLHPVKVLVGWEDQGSRHTGDGGMADKGSEGTGGRQVSRMQSGERGERAAGTKKKKKLNSTQSPSLEKSIWICSRQNQK